MEQNPPNNDLMQGLTLDQQKYLASLQHDLAEAVQRGQRFEESWSNLFDQNKTLREENHRIQQGYETLRIQKGGFGFKMLLFSGIGGFVTALVLCFVYLRLKPKEPHVAALQNFRREHLFEYELALSKKQFPEVKTSLEKELHRTENQSIKTNLEIMRELIEAAEKGCD
jgi:hypothetical protein